MSYPNVQLLIDNQWRAARGDTTLKVYNPADGKVIGTVARASKADLEDALASASKGFEVWRKTPAMERALRVEATSS